jgi:hypothetical protein
VDAAIVLGVEWSDVKTLEDLRTMHPTLADGLTEKSVDFFHTESTTNPNIEWEVERKPLQTERLILRPNQQVSRAWDVTFRSVLDKLITPRVVPFYISQPTRRGEQPNLSVELPDEDREQSKQFVEALNTATDVTNAVIQDAKRANRREHEQLASDLGLSRTRVGFES